MSPWARYLTSLSLRFFICKMGLQQQRLHSSEIMMGNPATSGRGRDPEVVPLSFSTSYPQPLTVQHHHIPMILQWRPVRVSITTTPTSFLHQLYCWGCTSCKKLTLEAQQVHLGLPWLWSRQHLDTPAASLVGLFPALLQCREFTLIHS